MTYLPLVRSQTQSSSSDSDLKMQMKTGAPRARPFPARDALNAGVTRAAAARERSLVAMPSVTTIDPP